LVLLLWACGDEADHGEECVVETHLMAARKQKIGEGSRVPIALLQGHSLNDLTSSCWVPPPRGAIASQCHLPQHKNLWEDISDPNCNATPSTLISQSTCCYPLFSIYFYCLYSIEYKPQNSRK
jgi:hypothetical protein